MDNGDKIEALKYLSQTHRASLESRFRREFQVLYISLSFYVLVTAAYLTYLKDEIPTPISCSPYFALYVWAFLILTGMWPVRYLVGTSFANNTNMNLAEQAEDELTRTVGLFPLGRGVHPNRYTYFGEGVLITLFASAAGWLITISNSKTGSCIPWLNLLMIIVFLLVGALRHIKSLYVSIRIWAVRKWRSWRRKP